MRLQERILYSTFLNRSFCIIIGAAEIYKDSSKESAPTSANIEKALQNKVTSTFKLKCYILYTKNAFRL